MDLGNSMGKKVQILMSTYNGEKYLREQLDSLLAQSYPDIEILIRDDGSKDHTVSVLQEYSNRYDNIQVFPEKNTGVTDSFFELLKKSDADYIAFCDQDDVWLEQKVERAVDKISSFTEPALYIGNKILVDADLNIISKGDSRSLKPGFGNALVESIGSGCTMMMNRSLAEALRLHIPKQAVIHDWWCYLAAAYLGTVVYDQKPYIWYRQHGNNEVGGSDSFFGQLKGKIRYLKKSRGKLAKQLEEFKQYYHSDEKKDRQLQELLDASAVSKRMKVVRDKTIYRQNGLDNRMMHLLVLANRML